MSSLYSRSSLQALRNPRVACVWSERSHKPARVQKSIPTPQTGQFTSASKAKDFYNEQSESFKYD
jgi:hypothetical protein